MSRPKAQLVETAQAELLGTFGVTLFLTWILTSTAAIFIAYHVT